jgi:UDP-glucose 4-epimerase
MKVLVTGGSGFLGSHVADALSEENHEVIIFDQKNSPYLRADQTMVVGDILDQELVEQLVKESDAIYHFAGIADIEEASKNPIRTLETNVMGTMVLLEAARKSTLQRFIFSSSIYVYSNRGAFYRTSKKTCEQLIEDYNLQFGLNYTILRFGSLYGPRAAESNAVHQLIKQALETNTMAYKGTGEEIREYIHAKDGAAAAVEMLEPEFENQIIHLTGHERMTTLNMMEMITEILGSDVPIKVNTGEVIGHYFQTPYSYTPKLGKKLVRNSYIDIGLGLLDLIALHHQFEVESEE